MTQPDIYAPEFALASVALDDGSEVMVLEVHTAAIQATFMLATRENYRQVADRLAEGIRRMGAELKGPSLITNVKELPDGLRQASKGG